MLLLKGRVGKSVIIERLSKYANTFVYGYVDEIPCCIEDMICALSRETSIEMFCQSIEKDILKKNICETIIVYTNLSEEEISPIRDVIEKLEKINAFRFGIITCK